MTSSSPKSKAKSGKFSWGYQLNVKVHDIVFEEGTNDENDKEDVGFYIYRNMKFVDLCDMNDPHMVQVPLKNAKPEEVVRVIIQNQSDDEFHGSISLHLQNYFINEEAKKDYWYKQWITLFDDPEDDHYDGNLEEDDDEDPRILVEFMITQVPMSNKSSPARKRKAKKTVDADIGSPVPDSNKSPTPVNDVSLDEQPKTVDLVNSTPENPKNAKPDEEAKQEPAPLSVEATPVSKQSHKIARDEPEPKPVQVKEPVVSKPAEPAPEAFQPVPDSPTDKAEPAPATDLPEAQPRKSAFKSAKPDAPKKAAFTEEDAPKKAAFADEDAPKKATFAEEDAPKNATFAEEDAPKKTDEEPKQKPHFRDSLHHDDSSSRHSVKKSEGPEAHGLTQEEYEKQAQKKKDMFTAANAAKGRRSTITGKIRGVGVGREDQRDFAHDPENISFMFGGSAKPKLATEKVDVRKEKEKAMEWIRAEVKKYDPTSMKEDQQNKLAQTINNIKKDHKDMIHDENRQLRRLDKLDYLHTELNADKKELEIQCKEMEDQKNMGNENFEAFDQARADYKNNLVDDLSAKKEELQNLQDELKAKQNENEKAKDAINAQRENDKKDGHKGNPECEKASIDIDDKEKIVDDLRNNAADDRKQLQEGKDRVDQLKIDSDKQGDDLSKDLQDQSKKRDLAQDDRDKAERELAKAQAENAGLLKDQFKNSSEADDLQKRNKIAEKRNKLNSDKKKVLIKELSGANDKLGKNLKKAEDDVKKTEDDVEKAKKEADALREQLDGVENANKEEKAKGWENRIEDLEKQLRDAEKDRKEAQEQNENAGNDMNSKTKAFLDPHEDRAKSTKDLLSQIEDQNDDLKKKNKNGNDLQKQLDDLKKRKNEHQDRDALQQDYEEAGAEYDRLADDLQNQIDGIQEDVDKTIDALNDRRNALAKQIEELGNLKNAKAAQDREIDQLNKQIEELKVQNNRYDNDIKNLNNEIQILEEQAAELEATLEGRIRDCDETQHLLDMKDKQIQYLQEILRGQARESNKKEAKSAKYHIKKGDMLDELLGNYINENECGVPITRLGNGYYLFGTRKIYAKIFNGKLVIRVGGGYMVIGEFIRTYEDQELGRMELRDKRDHEREAAEDQEKADKKQKRKETIEARPDALISGTHRQKRITQAQIDRMKKANPNAVRQLK